MSRYFAVSSFMRKAIVFLTALLVICLGCKPNVNSSIPNEDFTAVEGVNTPKIGSINIKMEELVSAIKSDDGNQLSALLSTDAEFDSVDENGNSLLMIALRTRSKDCFELLLSKGADLNHQNLRGDSVVNHAARIPRNSYWLNKILDSGANPNIVNFKSRDYIDMYPEFTPLFDAVDANSIKNVDLLVGAGADINYKNGLNETPLVIAVSMKRFAVAYSLIKSGADCTAQDTEGRTVVELLADCDEDLFIDVLASSEEEKAKNEEAMRIWYRRLVKLLEGTDELENKPDILKENG